MLHIHFSNRTEILTRRLIAELGRPRADALAPDQLIVPSTSLRRWLTLAIADARGICANVEFSYLASWLWQQMGRLVDGVAAESPFAPAVLGWRIDQILAQHEFAAAHPRLAAYLAGADDVMRFELARQIAALFDQYLTYRPDWLAAWQDGRSVAPGNPDEGWQAALWRHLSDASGPAAADLGARFVAALDRRPAREARAAGLPAAAHVFALPTMPALHIDWLARLARVVDIHLYVLNPCQEYWFELIDRRRLAHLALRGADAHQETGNRLLAGWGRQTQAQIDGLVDRAGDGALDDAVFAANDAPTLLAALQNAILELDELAPGTLAIAPGDRSVEVHVGHSLTRQLEVLHDQLLGLLASGAVQHPSQVLVVTPDLDAAAPLIEAVFGTAPRERRIPFTITGRARSQVNASARALLALLTLLRTRFAASAVFELLQQEIVARRFGFDAATLVPLHDALQASGARWGLDATHRAEFGVPAAPEHTWSDALDRLFLGYALPSAVGEPFAELLPAGDIEGAQSDLLGSLWQFLAQLRDWRSAVSGAHPPATWGRLLGEMVHGLTAPRGNEVDDQRELLEAIADLVLTMARAGLDAAPAQPVGLPLLHAALQRQLDDPARGGVPSGGVTFSAMSSLRGLPFARVCAIGLDDGAFPSADRTPEFDLMAAQPRRGDRQRRNDERNLFLDLLLAARDGFYLSYTGRSVRDNAALPPSVLVAELLDVLVPAIAADPSSPDSLAQARSRLVVEHPLQPFSVEAFRIDADPRLRSFDRETAAALRHALQAAAAPGPATRADADRDRPHAGGAGGASALGDDDVPDSSDPDGDGLDGDDGDSQSRSATQAPFFASALPAPSAEWHSVSLRQLTDFFRNPCRYLLERRLDIAIEREAAELQDDEPFVVDLPARRALAGRLLPAVLAGADAAALQALASAGRELPGGALGRQQLARELDSLCRFGARVRTLIAAPPLAPQHALLPFEIDGERWTLEVDFGDLRAAGLVRWRYDELRARDVLAAWIEHLSLCARAPAGIPARTTWVAIDQTLRLLAPDDAMAELRSLLALYRRGLSQPLAFFPKSAWVYINEKKNLSAARQKWAVTRQQRFGESADPAYRLALRGVADPLGGEFTALAEQVFGPVMRATDDAA